MTRIVKPKNTLKEKAGHGGFKAENLERAQKAIDENVVDFVPIATNYLSELFRVIDTAQRSGITDNIYAEVLDPLMQLRAQGALFHYPSVTVLTDIVVDLLDSLKTVDGTIIEIIAAYEKGAKALLSAQIKDGKHQICQALAGELRKVCQKYKDKTS